jgi:glycosyltransferase involved in cell wall biosynthesis
LPTLLVVHSISFATYQAARALRDYVHHTICVSPRIRDDLVQRYGFSATQASVIFNAVPDELLKPSMADAERRFRVLSLGRIEHSSKGILDLPRIMRQVDDSQVRLAVAGTGPDEARLAAKLAASRVPHEWLGLVARDRLPAVLASHGIFLFPSRYEGLGIALLEAMAAGLVPVASRIRGVTDVVVEDGKSGLLVSPGDCSASARAVQRLLDDEKAWLAMSAAARERARTQFSVGRMAEGYARLMAEVEAAPRSLPRLAVTDWRYPRRLSPGFRQWLPRPIRAFLRNLAAR